MTRDLIGRRVVAVHAHPDDESIATGGTLAQLARRGAEVTVITCTLGEEGEIIGETYQHLAADDADQLGGFRIHELAQALRHLGVRGHFLGGPGTFRDSGMAGAPSHEHPRAFVNSGERAVDLLAEQFEKLRPELVITYGPDGGYGHPDHIRAHEITHAAAERVDIPRIVWAVANRAPLERAAAEITQIPQGWRAAEVGELPGVDKHDLAVRLSEADYHAKREAMRAHTTQLWIADGSISRTNPHAAKAVSTNGMSTFALSNLIAQPLMDVEHYQIGRGAGVDSEDDDLFAGI
ncbi:N-acetyl-1-D-myo-inositol-2-amino-2-deoxy-alpha-D-glucopyranoside deacetylase [Corynebacterium yudongzhengii]|uniref:1D-myo-inositol 2-acetamido-2-deoxy-alpha-D-glucopyranoside deacetylase n=1 Tax=Corynebacterium yudongzhengii TaxID=2080740 RepID=A0A2U1T492_9CORY|nr:N-acetyl-1-D-myo-inositol-2-amino-2-deoxy-alpha-D-glucopyranoside deacetylase [Corynebacterium yudongzhengii]AWB82172.1 N-acetyl-1-D-myo-inositol-2-amino-2-deoxy-alpha-D-glucopyranoside deacetylase [Corynebacterium yudongzhengii]PWC00803.1 N-acetyl-1-D-myo-inositol-2-amino-2-deoxy-alpha-D-glucopyranoside deacetylase [Corynebacterium yudongzhengii]